MTPEQSEKFITKFINDMTKISERLKETLDDYVATLKKDDHIVDINKKVEPTPSWIPEVGKLYRHPTIENHYFTYIGFSQILYKYRVCVETKGHINKGEEISISETEFNKLIPIAELEGLKVGDFVYSELGEAWLIDNIDGEVIVITGQGLIELDVEGVPYAFTNQQLFWRTADRAKRFGRV